MLSLKKMPKSENVLTLVCLRKTAGEARKRMSRAVQNGNNIRSIMSAKMQQKQLVDSYKAREIGTDEWSICFTPPAEERCAEWLYFDAKGMPAMYWSSASGYMLL